MAGRPCIALRNQLRSRGTYQVIVPGGGAEISFEVVSGSGGSGGQVGWPRFPARTA